MVRQKLGCLPGLAWSSGLTLRWKAQNPQIKWYLQKAHNRTRPSRQAVLDITELAVDKEI